MTDPNFATMSGHQNGSPSDQELDDTFEQDLRDMLRDGPTLSDSASTIQGGNVTESPFAGIDLSSPIRPQLQSPGANRSPHRPIASSSVGSRLAGDPPSMSKGPPQMGQAQSSPNTGGYPGPGGGFGKPGDPGDSTSAMAKAKFDTFKTWSISTYKCTRQMLSEKLGKGSRTVDLQLEAQIEVLRDTQRKYANILKLSRALTHHFYQVVQTQRSLGDAFGELGQKSPELQEEFNYNCETQRSLCANGETLLGALNFFTSNVNTLCNKTMEDTLMTVKLYESARIEYDAYRVDLESLQIAPKDSTTQSKINEAKNKYEKQKIKFDKLRQDVSVKLKFLEENKVKVMHKQLLLFHNAISAYFSGNQQALEATLKQFSIKLRPPSEVQPSFLEQ